MTIGERLKEERSRLGMTQPDFAALAGTTKKSQITYEKGGMPDAAYLAAIANAGADVQYIVTGERKGAGIGEPAVHQAVLDAVDLLSLEGKVDAQQLAKAVVKLCQRGGGTTMQAGQAVQVTRGGAIINAPVSGGVAGRNIIHKGRNKAE